MKIIATMRCDFPEKFAIPRQSGILNELEGRIEFAPEFQNPDYIRGIEDFSHLWLLWCFSENVGKKSSPTVRPPRLGGNKRVGVFATRSPFRPNPIGLSSVRLVRVEEKDGKLTLIVKGADLMDGTPIYDIKPYLAYADSHPDALGGFAQAFVEYGLDVVIPDELMAQVLEEKREALMGVLAQDPRPSYQNDPDRIYGITFGKQNIKFRVENQRLTVIDVETP